MYISSVIFCCWEIYFTRHGSLERVFYQMSRAGQREEEILLIAVHLCWPRLTGPGAIHDRARQDDFDDWAPHDWARHDWAYHDWGAIRTCACQNRIQHRAAAKIQHRACRQNTTQGLKPDYNTGPALEYPSPSPQGRTCHQLRSCLCRRAVIAPKPKLFPITVVRSNKMVINNIIFN